ncbi:MAG TPA: hypothetical protein VF796_03860 [Humisphaera sp.]
MTRTRSIVALTVVATATFAGGCGGPDVPPQPPASHAAAEASPLAKPAQVYGSEFEVRLDRPAMAAAGVDQTAVADALAAFFKARPTFTLSELNAVRVPAGNGREVPLRQIATVDVRFGPAKTEILIGDEGK